MVTLQATKDIRKVSLWLGHASVMVKGSKTVYVDPWEVSATDPADVILITHDHFDHLSETDARREAVRVAELIGRPLDVARMAAAFAAA